VQRGIVAYHGQERQPAQAKRDGCKGVDLSGRWNGRPWLVGFRNACEEGEKGSRKEPSCRCGGGTGFQKTDLP
jgi:hypothetical protein